LTLHGFAAQKSDLPKYADNAERWIFGSDIIWHDTNEYVYFADWISGRGNLIAYAASFCNDQIPQPDKYKAKCMRRFSAVSCREESGVRICKNYAGIDAKLVLDPTLLL
jgi:hypothetical protein